ncbi:hypothetical protein [Candidatus Contubernalis alkaliaceticus]|uniref:hypothetical protein n=1 Tax=Candidatus Contubernalis alkaliaceticus TaxID=338645 RepID=UPI001F4BEFB0|nr:hypothetical protein [Candidatus Contubernalis alkalaceticus]UNC92724.1 hypothetical protein HUE98_11825 [Candidatus Contubernalis alkalaceticus]
MDAICDKCGYDFRIESVLVEKVDENVSRHYFCCYECGEKYYYMIVDEEIEKLLLKQKELQMLRHLALEAEDYDKYEDLLEEYEGNKDIILKMQDELKLKCSV